MKKYILLLSIALGGIVSSCDYNEHNFEGLDEASMPGNVASYQYTVTDADIATIVKALNANKNSKDSATAKILNADKMFSVNAKSNELIPYLLANKYYSADVKSAALIKYRYNAGKDSVVKALSSAPYTLTNNDYKVTWGNDFVAAFTPSKSQKVSIPSILAKNEVSSKKGAYKNVEYYYSQEEPVSSTVENIVLNEGLEEHSAGSGVLIDINGWLNKDLKGTIGWQCRSYSSNNYAQVSAFKSGTENDVWLITKAIDLKNMTAPKLSFDVNVGNYNANCLTVLISDNFDGTDANITKATWTDVTANFAIPQIPASGYGVLATAGSFGISNYAGKKVYVAFRYQGDDSSATKKTTTYQLDNIKVSESVTGLSVAKKELEYASYLFDGSKWVSAPTYVITLQPADYTAMGLTYLTTAQAATYLPGYLKLELPYAQEGKTVYVVYKTSKSACYSDMYKYTNGNWILNSFVTEEQDQFVRSTKGWVFDPTISETLLKGKEDTDGYMMLVNYVKANQAINNPSLVSSYGDAEYYYGFSANYGNVSYRDKDRSLDPSYPSTGTKEEKEAFLNQRTIDAIQTYLTLKYPNATPEVAGIDQFADIVVLIYSSHISTYTNEYWSYKMQCTGNKQWKYIGRMSQYGTLEMAK